MKNRIIPYNPVLKEYARELRNHSTLSEALLWKKIKRKSLGVEFHRQVPVDRYIVDFYCHELMLAIEIDGSSHDGKYDSDLFRQQQLEDFGVHFIRFTDISVKREMNNVLRALELKINELQGKTSPLPPFKGGIGVHRVETVLKQEEKNMRMDSISNTEIQYSISDTTFPAGTSKFPL